MGDDIIPDIVNHWQFLRHSWHKLQPPQKRRLQQDMQVLNCFSLEEPFVIELILDTLIIN